MAPKPVLSSPVLPSHPSPQPGLFQKGSPSPEGAVPRDGALWPRSGLDFRHQLILIDELVASHLCGGVDSWVRTSQGAVLGACPRPCAYLNCGPTVGEREAEDHEGPGLLGRGAAGGGIGQVDVGQRDPVRQGCFPGHHQDKVAISEALDSCWDKGGLKRPVRPLRLVSMQHGHGGGVLGDSI